MISHFVQGGQIIGTHQFRMVQTSEWFRLNQVPYPDGHQWELVHMSAMPPQS